MFKRLFKLVLWPVKKIVLFPLKFLLYSLLIFIDKNVMSREKLFIGAGNRVSKFFLSPESLVNLTDAEVLDLT